MTNTSEGRQRLTEHLLADCAAELRRVTEERDAIKFENGQLRARLNIHEAKTSRLEAVLAQEAMLLVESAAGKEV
jgi:hypothetical protein